MKCPYWDSGWCYAPLDVETSADNGACPGSENCSYYTDVYCVEITEQGDNSEEHF